MTDTAATGPAERSGKSIAIVGLACRYPDADDTAALLDAVLTSRRAFRRIPPARFDLDDYYNPDLDARDATYGTRAALLEGWRFDRSAFGVSRSDYLSADPSRWLALETAAAALASAGFPGGNGLPADRAGVYIGNTPASDGAPAAALRLRWPYTRRVLADALATSGVAAGLGHQVLAAAAAGYLEPFPPVTEQTLAGRAAATIATTICAQFGFRGGGFTVDAAGGSSLAAIISACQALSAGEVDAGVAGGVDLSIDPFDLVALAKSGQLARGDMRVYDEVPTGFLPGEGCGILLLTRTEDARAASLPVYAEIRGWGVASRSGPAQGGTGNWHELTPEASARLLAMNRAHEMAMVDPADVQLFEGCGLAIGAADDAELAALAVLRAGAQRVGVLGSITGNIGNTGAAAGVAGLLKAVLAMANGVLPPTAGVRAPHPVLRDGRLALRLSHTPERWPPGTRHAGVGAAGPDGLAVHLVLRGEPDERTSAGKAPQVRSRTWPRAVKARPPSPGWSPWHPRTRSTEPAIRLAASRTTGTYAAGPAHSFAYLLGAPDRPAMVELLSRLAATAPWLSDAQLQDLAVHCSRSAAVARESGQDEVRIALTASGQEQLAGLAATARKLVATLKSGILTTRPGIYAAVGPVRPAAAAGPGGPAEAAGSRVEADARGPADAAGTADVSGAAEVTGAAGVVGSAGMSGRVGLVIAAQPDELADLPQRQLSRILAVLGLLDELGVEVSAAVGHSVGELAGLVWAGCITAADARALIALRLAAPVAPPGTASGELGSSIDKLSTFTFRRPWRRLISGSTGSDIAEPRAIAEMLCTELFEARVAVGDGSQARGAGGWVRDNKVLVAAITTAAEGAVLLVQTGRDPDVGSVMAQLGPGTADQPGGCAVATVAIDGDPADDGSVADAAAALFVIGALTKPQALYARRPSRPIDIRRDQSFITHPCSQPPVSPAAARPGIARAAGGGDEAESARLGPDGRAGTPQNGEAGSPQDAGAGSPQDGGAGSPRDGGADSPQDAGAGTPQDAGAGSPQGGGADPAHQARTEAGEDRRSAVAAGTASAEPRSSAATSGVNASDATAIGAGTGVAPWFRCYAERTQEPALVVPAADDQPWRLHTGGCGPLDQKVGALFLHDDDAGRTLVVLGELDDAATREAAVQAVKDAISTGQLVAISQGPGLAGLWATLHAEHPGIGITAIRAPLTPAGLAAARRVAGTSPAQYRELIIDNDGTVTEPVMRPLPGLGGSDVPLDAEDVVLISSGTGPAGLAFAQVLACSGAAVAIVGRVRRARDDGVVAGLEQLRGAGARICYELVNMADHAAVAAAVRRIEARFGSVTAISHASSPLPRVAIARLTPASLHNQVRTQTAPLNQLAAAARAVVPGGSGRSGPLRLIATFGSVTGRYGLAKEGMCALVTAAIAELGEHIAAASPGCQALHVDWPAWSGDALTQQADRAEAMARAGFTAMPVSEGSRLLLKALATDGLPRRLAIHGRVGVTAPQPVAAASTIGRDLASWRFIERALVHYPGVELIAEATLSLLADPYLGDYRADGVPVLPPTMALEAMAQAASALAGKSVRHASDVSLSAPVVLPAGTPGSHTVIRIFGLRDGDSISVRIRSDNSGFAVDHCNATFSVAAEVDAGEAAPTAEATAGQAAEPGQAAGAEGSDSSELDESGLHEPQPHEPQPHEPQPHEPQLTEPEVTGPEASAAELYGPVLFQAGRFRRLTSLRQTGEQSAAGVADGTDELPWFGAVPPARAAALKHELVLGSIGLSDAVLQVVQACVPHRRLMFAACDSVSFSDSFRAGRMADGGATILVTRETTSGSEPSAPGRMDASQPAIGRTDTDRPDADRQDDGRSGASRRGSGRRRGDRKGLAGSLSGPRTAAGQLNGPAALPAWNVQVIDAAGHTLMTWNGLRMRDAGPLRQRSRPAARLLSSD
jgi:enediyne polyketide synthase